MKRIEEAEQLVTSEAHHGAMLQLCRLRDALIVDVRLGVDVRWRDGDDADLVRQHAVVRVDVRRAQLEEAGTHLR